MKNIIIVYEETNEIKQIYVEEKLFQKEFEKLFTNKNINNINIQKTQ